MRRLIMAAALLSGCASAPLSVSPTTMALQRLTLTERLPLQPHWDVAGASHATHLERLREWAEDQGIVVADVHLAERKQLLGFAQESRTLGWVVLLDAELPPNGKLQTLAHELSHIHAPADTFKDAKTAEVFAELSAAQVCDQLGLDTWRETAAYLKTMTTLEDQARTAAKYHTQIDAVVAKLVKAARPQ